MKPMIYIIEFEDEEYFGDIAFFLKEIKSPIRLEVGDKIALNHASFDRLLFYDINNDDINEMMEVLFKRSIKASNYRAYFEISDIVYNHEWYNHEGEFNFHEWYNDNDEDEFNFHGTIILKGK